MEPGFYRGDLLFLYQTEADFNVGEVTVFTFDQRSIPIVHRILEVHKTCVSVKLFLTSQGQRECTTC